MIRVRPDQSGMIDRACFALAVIIFDHYKLGRRFNVSDLFRATTVTAAIGMLVDCKMK